MLALIAARTVVLTAFSVVTIAKTQRRKTIVNVVVVSIRIMAVVHRALRILLEATKTHITNLSIVAVVVGIIDTLLPEEVKIVAVKLVELPAVAPAGVLPPVEDDVKPVDLDGYDEEHQYRQQVQQNVLHERVALQRERERRGARLRALEVLGGVGALPQEPLDLPLLRGAHVAAGAASGASGGSEEQPATAHAPGERARTTGVHRSLQFAENPGSIQDIRPGLIRILVYPGF